jgi:hypothetical protein
LDRLAVRLEPTWKTLRALFARSSNRCAFPGCTEELVTNDDLFVGQVCHISAAEARGRRYDTGQTDEQRRSPANLLLLCYPHHVRVDAPDTTFTAKQLTEIKRAHEKKSEAAFQPPENILRALGADLDAYWERVSGTNAKLQAEHIPAAAFDRAATPLALLEQIQNGIRRLRNVHENVGPEASIHPEDVKNYLVPNAYIHLGLRVAQLRVRLLEMQLKDDPAVETAGRLAAAQKELEGLVASGILND